MNAANAIVTVGDCAILNVTSSTNLRFAAKMYKGGGSEMRRPRSANS
jgi:hypothetical protein